MPANQSKVFNLLHPPDLHPPPHPLVLQDPVLHDPHPIQFSLVYIQPLALRCGAVKIDFPDNAAYCTVAAIEKAFGVSSFGKRTLSNKLVKLRLFQ
jgi:hypothetical protein